MKLELSTHIAGLTVLAGLLSAADRADAADTFIATGYEVYPGLMCVDRDDATPDIRYQFNGSALNASASATPINCPIIRHTPGTNLNIEDWDITVDRNGSTASFTVSVFSNSADGTQGFSTSITVPNPGLNGFQHLDGGNVNQSFTGGQLWLGFDLPAGAEIARYEIFQMVD